MKNTRIALGLILLVFVLISFGFLVSAQSPTLQTTIQTNGIAPGKISAPDAQEIADSARLIDAVNAGDSKTALEILHAYGVADSILEAMSSNLAYPPANAELGESFMKASHGVMWLGDHVMETNLLATSQNVFDASGYERPIWMPRHLEITPVASYNATLLQAPLAPVVVLNLTLNDACFIRWFMWCDRYVDYVHSIAINGGSLNNGKLDEANYGQASRQLNALFRLIKARKPNTFVWLWVGKMDNLSDEKWLRAMPFRPDGLQIDNLRQFHSPFELTRARYAKIVGTNMPMMVVGFYGHTMELEKEAATLKNAIKSEDQSAVTEAMRQLGGIGRVVGGDLALEEAHLQSLGYCGIGVQWPLLVALANTNDAATANKSNLIDKRAELLDIYFDEKDYARVLSLAQALSFDSSAGDMNWTVGKLYEGIALLNQTPPDTKDAITRLDEILTFDFTNRPGRDHYILGAAKWRIYADALTGDKKKTIELVQWVRTHNFRSDLKEDFLKHYDHLALLQAGSN